MIRARPRCRARGFTLIEVLVAIAAMALLALMSWRGIDGMARAQSQTRERADAVVTLQTALAQWSADLDGAMVLPRTQAIDWNGQTLRLTRRSTPGDAAAVQVVAWTLLTSQGITQWRRWQSLPITTRAEWQQAWSRAEAWGRSGSSDGQGSDVALLPLNSWRLFYFSNNAWQNPTAASAAASGTAIGTNTLPDGVRLVLNLTPGAALSGVLTRDWVRPTLAKPKS